MDAVKLDWNVYELTRKMDKNVVDFDVSIQRGVVWDQRRESLLIHSILKGYPISIFYFNKVEKKYEGLEGKQRANAIYNFVKLGAKLHSQTPPVINDEGEEVQIARHTFETLSPELQNRINQYGLIIHAFDNMTLNDKKEFFERINSGKQVTAAEIARINVLSRNDFIDLTKHIGIQTALKAISLRKMVDEDIVEDMWILANMERPSFVKNDRTQTLKSTEMTEKQKTELWEAFDYLHAFYVDISNDKVLSSKMRSKKTHITMVGYAAVLARRKGIKKEDFVDKIRDFYDTGNRIASNSEKYNAASIQGSNKTENVAIRMREMEQALEI